MLLYALFGKASVTGFIEFLGITEPDQVVGGALVDYSIVLYIRL